MTLVIVKAIALMKGLRDPRMECSDPVKHCCQYFCFVSCKFCHKFEVSLSHLEAPFVQWLCSDRQSSPRLVVLMISLALLSKTYPTENFPYQRALVWLFTMSFSSGLVVDDVRVLLDGLGCQASLSSLPRKGWQLNPSETCSHFPYDKVSVLPCIALDKAQPLAIGLREHSSIKNG